MFGAKELVSVCLYTEGTHGRVCLIVLIPIFSSVKLLK